MISIDGHKIEKQEDVKHLSDEQLVGLMHAGGGSARVPGMWAASELRRRDARQRLLAFCVGAIGTAAAIVAAIASVFAVYKSL